MRLIPQAPLPGHSARDDANPATSRRHARLPCHCVEDLLAQALRLSVSKAARELLVVMRRLRDIFRGLPRSD